ncbi:uncharacterized protein LOC130614593 [Hydractinia symbiolongicarpus]|uniref:uncharacterized protein LOC130614593 n=1 Tax=Hydractinia symbiolongicarpus TaxID=13093 RepID=UPI00254E8C05|nr:uncharacterized protein LOC130614593 [Hydractinia symbiolongicarpus]
MAAQLRSTLYCMCIVFGYLKAIPWTERKGGKLNSVRENTTCTKEIDIVLLIDSSRSVQEKWNDIIDAAQTLQADFEIDDNATRVGIIDIGVVANVYKHLDSNNTNEETFQLLEQLREKHQNDNISLEDGIFMAVKLLSAATPLRSDTKKVILLYTDAEFAPNEDQRIMEYIRYLNYTDVTVIACIYDSVANSKIDEIQRAGHIHVHHFSNNSQFPEDEVRKEICSDKKESVPRNDTLSFPTQTPTTTQSSTPSLNTSQPMINPFLLLPQFDASEPVVHLVTDKVGSLYSHNYLRALHGAPPLRWDDNLAYKASSWAHHLALSNQGMSHSSMQGYGENVYSHSGASSYVHSYIAAHRWYEGVKNYDYGHPHFTPYAGTFTEMIWKSTTSLGVGIAYRPDSKRTYIVAIYQPGGNLLSVQAYKENVLLPLAGLPARVPDVNKLKPPEYLKASDTSPINQGMTSKEPLATCDGCTEDILA